MIIVCAWCGQKIGDKPDQDGGSSDEITHGICPSCKEQLFSDRQRTLDNFLNTLDEPVLVINPQGEVELANNSALKFLGKKLEAVSGFKGGDVMECVYARLPEGCGNTSHCVACTIRHNVMETFRTGQSLRQVPAFLKRDTRNSIHTINFLISTEKVGDVVLLRIDEVLAP